LMTIQGRTLSRAYNFKRLQIVSRKRLLRLRRRRV